MSRHPLILIKGDELRITLSSGNLLVVWLGVSTLTREKEQNGGIKLTNETEYLKALLFDLKRWRKSHAVVNKAINDLSVCKIDEIAEKQQQLQEAKQARDLLIDEFGKDRLAEIERLSARNKRRWMRVRSAVRKMLNEPCPVLVTLTFNEETLFSTNETTRRTYVRKYLSNQTPRYFANRDFGAKNGREHYHAICTSTINPTEWKHGTCNVKVIRKPKEDDRETVSRLAKYIDKLTNHALKPTAEDSIIWSRGFNHTPHWQEVDADDEDFLAWLDELGG